MSWNILPKNVLQYFLEKIKSKFMLILNHDILGAKNILPFPYTYGSGTNYGLTITVHEDGSITAQGTPTQTIMFLINDNIIKNLSLWQGSEMIFSEWEVQNQNAFAALLLGQSTPISEVRGDYKLTVTSEMIQQGVAFILYFGNGVDLTTPITFKPMVRLATDPDHTWRSPALTNKQLTDSVFYLSYAKSHVSANPSTTTGVLNGLEIDGTAYEIQGTGEPNVQADWDEVDSTADDYIKNKPTIPDISTKVSKSGDTMSGTLSMGTTDNVAIDFRPNHADYHTTISHQTGGNEACVFATKNAVTSFIFANGEDSITNHSSNRWQSLTPALQMKNGKVAIGKLIANGTTPTDSLDVAGNTKLETLNSLPPNTYMGVIESGNSIINVLKNTAPFGVSLWLTQQADDSPTKGSVSCTMICKHTGTGAYSYVYHFNSNGVIRIAGTGNPAPSSLTWTQIDARNANYANSAGSATDSSKEPKLSWTYKSSSGSWNYWKDSGNRYHLHYSSGNASVNYNSQLGALYYVNSVYTINFPVTLTAAYSINVSCACSNGLVGATVQSYTASQVKLYLWASQSGSKTIQIFMDIVST